MLQVEQPDTFVLATNRTVAVRDFVSMAARAAGFDLQWEGVGEDDRGVGRETGRTLVRVNPKFYRPAEVDLLIGNADKARKALGWVPETSLEVLCQMMVEADIRRNERGFSF